ncbi:unnamed protein product, partial [Trichobilharzia regenti]
SCYTQIIATTALTKYVSNRDAIISHASRLAIRDFALNYLAGQAGLEKFVQQALITLICRLTKLGWLDSIDNGPGFCDILDCASKFIEVSNSVSVCNCCSVKAKMSSSYSSVGLQEFVWFQDFIMS